MLHTCPISPKLDKIIDRINTVEFVSEVVFIESLCVSEVYLNNEEEFAAWSLSVGQPLLRGLYLF